MYLKKFKKCSVSTEKNAYSLKFKKKKKLCVLFFSFPILFSSYLFLFLPLLKKKEKKGGYLLTSTLLNPRRDHDGRNPDPQAIKMKQKGFGSHNPIRAGDPTDRSGHMIKEPTMLIISDHEQGLVPLRASPESFVHLLHEHLPLVHVMGWMIIIGGGFLGIRVPLLHHNVPWELPGLSVALER